MCNDAFPLVPLVRSDAVLYRCCVRGCVTAVLHSLEFGKHAAGVLLTLAKRKKIDKATNAAHPRRRNGILTSRVAPHDAIEPGSMGGRLARRRRGGTKHLLPRRESRAAEPLGSR